MELSSAARSRGPGMAAVARRRLLAVGAGPQSAVLLHTVRAYLDQNPDASAPLAASAILRRAGADRRLHMHHLGLLGIDGDAVQLSALGQLRLWRRRGRHTERLYPPPGAVALPDALGLAGSTVQQLRVPVSAGDRLVLAAQTLDALGPLALYGVLSSPRGPAAAADALLDQIEEDKAALGVLWVDPRR